MLWWDFNELSKLPEFLWWRALYVYSLFVLLPNYEQQLRLHTYNLYSQFVKFPCPEFSTTAANKAYGKFYSLPQCHRRKLFISLTSPAGSTKAQTRSCWLEATVAYVSLSRACPHLSRENGNDSAQASSTHHRAWSCRSPEQEWSPTGAGPPGGCHCLQHGGEGICRQKMNCVGAFLYLFNPALPRCHQLSVTFPGAGTV